MDNRDNIDSFEQSLRRSLEGVEVSPSPQTWSRIEASMAAAKRLSPLVLLARWSGAVAAAVIVAVAVNYWFTTSEQIELYESKLITEFAELEKLPIALPALDIEREAKFRMALAELTPATKLPEEPKVTKSEEPEAEEQQPTNETTPKAEEAKPTTTPTPTLELRKPSSRRGVRLALNYGEGESMTGGFGGGVDADAAPSSPMNSGLASAPAGYVNLISKSQYSPRSVNHRATITFAASVAYDLSKRWSVESGLSYSRLTSDIVMSYTDHTMVQRVELLGIPLRVNYDIFSSKRFSLYAALGGQVERRISSTLNKQHIDERNWHYSVDGALGAQYNINRWLGLYVEPEVRYFLTPTELTTIRTDHPANLNMRFGLRFSPKGRL